MKRYLQRSRKTGLKAKRLFNNLVLLLLTTSCTSEFTRTDGMDAPVPSLVAFAYTIELHLPQFSPQKITADITGRIYVSGNSRRLIFFEQRERHEEIILESIYPCEIINIDTDGFDIFLLDHLNKKIWTVKQKMLLKSGFALQDHPLDLAISEKSHFALIFANRKELSIFSKNKTLFTTMHLEAPLHEDDMVDLLFRNNVLYITNGEEGRLNVLPIFSPSQKRLLDIPSPTSLAMDRMGNLFIAYEEGIGYLLRNEIALLHPLHGEPLEITIFSDSLFVLRPSARKIDVYSIVYTASGANAQ